MLPVSFAQERRRPEGVDEHAEEECDILPIPLRVPRTGESHSVPSGRTRRFATIDVLGGADPRCAVLDGKDEQLLGADEDPRLGGLLSQGEPGCPPVLGGRGSWARRSRRA